MVKLLAMISLLLTYCRWTVVGTVEIRHEVHFRRWPNLLLRIWTAVSSPNWAYYTCTIQGIELIL